ncbi:MAG: ATP-binding cassette domain-containing protein [Acidimicrobiaceae bacterium]|nr:ATP-binding cassette domain-containing protein [Acidimicrobiaceae bacterium]
MSKNEFRATAVGVDYGARVLLDDVDLLVTAGQMLVITGASGSGKTTLAHTLAGIIMPDRGEVTLDGAPLTQLGTLSARLALVTQDFGLLSVLTATEAVSLPLQVRSLAKDEIRDRTAQSLNAVGLLSCATRTVAELSGGQRQRVAIARALAMDADVIIMDEPTAELDPANRALVLSLLTVELNRGASLVVVSHESDLIARADFVYELVTPH